ncbi:sensor histidine kinase [Pseudoalteromonas sp. S16_S37]|uniref:sensor histidine kinase n=1 Tax=Pseudoalteromonas sp. S16_S37 TaxID=2720228 RepID=UPI001680AB6B|nr:histidine kinase [Pseudoalteromonas sp. S16_S37]MBD1582525.1 histidine kinase [Pseudoalteromonas sp. S16_S37]
MFKSSDLTSQLLPTIITPRGVLAMLVTSQILAFVLAFAPMSYENVWVRLGMFSLFVHTVSAVGFSALYVLRAYLCQYGMYRQVILIVATFAAITGMLSLIITFLFPEQEPHIDWSFLFKNMTICLFVSLLFIHTMTIFLDKLQTVETLSKVELEALSARIRPHFLYNSLNTIAELTQLDVHAAEQAVITLAQLCKATMHVQQLNSLAAELQLARRYLELEQWRFAERLAIDWQLPQNIPDVQLPVLTIQPLLENAIVHGVEGNSGATQINIKLTHSEAFIELEISNSYAYSQSYQPQGNGLALKNIRARLALHFGAKAGLHTEVVGDRYIVRLTLPLVGVS